MTFVMGRTFAPTVEANAGSVGASGLDRSEPGVGLETATIHFGWLCHT